MQVEEDNVIHAVIGHNIRECRKRRGMKQSELASSTGYSRTSIVNIEAGKQHITISSLYDVVRALDVSITDIIIEASDVQGLEEITSRISALEAENTMLREQNRYMQLLLNQIKNIAESRINRHE